MFLSLVSLSLAADSAIPSTPAPALAEERLVEVAPFGGKAENTVLAVVMTCWPSDTHNQLKYAPNVQELVGDAHAAADALSAREDTRVVRLFNPTLAEFDSTIDGVRAELGENGQYMKLDFLYTGLARGGDTNDEVALCPGGGIPWTNITTRLKPLSGTAIGVLDASYDVSRSAPDLGSTFGFTAKDWLDAGMPDGFAMSGPEGKYPGPGLLAAFAKVLEASKGGTMSMGDVVLGLRVHAPLYEVMLSTGFMTGDQWTGNTGRQMFPGGGLKKPAVTALPTTPPTKPKGKVPVGWIEVGGGAAFVATSAIFSGVAVHNYDLLETYDENGTTQGELDNAVRGYRSSVVGAIVTGAIGVAGLAVGTVTLVTDDHGRKATATFTGNGVAFGGTF